MAAALLGALALSAAGFAVATLIVWSSCRNYDVHAYPGAYPNCHRSAQTDRPEMAVVAGSLFFVFGAVAVYVATDRRDERLPRHRR